MVDVKAKVIKLVQFFIKVVQQLRRASGKPVLHEREASYMA